MMITDLKSPFEGRIRKRVLREKEQISIQEALRLTKKALQLKDTEEPEPDYDNEEPEPDYGDEEQDNYESSDIGLVDVRRRSTRFQSAVNISNLEGLNPQTIRQKIIQHEYRKKSMKDIFQQGNRYEKHTAGRGRVTEEDEEIDESKAVSYTRTIHHRTIVHSSIPFSLLSVYIFTYETLAKA